MQNKWVIEKAEKVLCYGYPGYIIQWNLYQSFKTKEERDKELSKLRVDDEFGMFEYRPNLYQKPVAIL